MNIRVKAHFDAAHRLDGYNGPCATLHGHRWQVLATFRTSALDSVGISTDFGTLKKALQEILPDHCFLNVWEPLKGQNPTAENLASVLAASIGSHFRKIGLDSRLMELELWETDAYSVVWLCDMV